MLHLIQKSPFQSQCLNQCLNVAKKTDTILLMLDGVYALQNTDFLSASTANQIQNVYVLEDDLMARGLSMPEKQPGNISTINYDKFVELTFNHSKTISWY